jgi:hypothetical protein
MSLTGRRNDRLQVLRDHTVESVCCPDMKRTEPFYQRNARLTTGFWSRNLARALEYDST